MKPLVRILPVGLIAIVVVVVACGDGAGKEAPAVSSHEIEPEATQILRQMTRHLSDLKAFSVSTQITEEDLIDSGHVADFDISTRVTVQRPNRLRSSRRGDHLNQEFFYDGKTLTLHSPNDRVYATVPAPPSVEGTIRFAVQSLELVVPACDLIYQGAYHLMMEGVTHAVVVGDAVLDGVACHHLFFSRPDVEFQVWVAKNGPPLPYKYKVTDTGTRESLSVTTVLSDWDTDPKVTDDLFEFRPPEGADAIEFLSLMRAGRSGR